MHSFVHHHRETSETQTGSTQGWVMNMGWRYDLMVWFFDTFLFRGTLRKFPQRTADLAQLQPGEAVLDVGCGTGALAMEASKRVGATGHVCGIDPGPKQQDHVAKMQFVASLQESHSWQTATAQAGLHSSQSTAYRLWAAWRQRGEGALSDGRHGHPIKLRGTARTSLEDYCQQTPSTPSLL